MAVSTKIWSDPTVGLPTIGTGSASESSDKSVGNFNASEFVDQATNVVKTDRLFAALVAKGIKRAMLLPGLYPAFSVPVDLPDGFMLDACPGAILQPSTASIGLFNALGKMTLQNFEVRVNSYVASQEIIRASGVNNVRCENLGFTCNDATATGFNGTPGAAAAHAYNEQKLISLVNVADKIIRGCRVYPQKGVTFLSSWMTGTSLDPASTEISGNHLNTPDKTYFPVGHRNYWRFIDIFGDQYGTIFANKAHRVGDTVNGDALLFIRGHSNAGVESGHWMIFGNQFEQFVTTNAVKFWGAPSINFYANMMGLAGKVGGTSVCVTDGDAGIYVTGQDGTPTGTAGIQVCIAGNDLHNITAADDGTHFGAFIYADRANGLDVVQNEFGVCQNNATLRIFPRTGGTPSANGVEKFVSNGNRFRTASGQTYVGRLEAGTFDGGCIIGSNPRFGFSSATVHGMNDLSNAGAAGRRKILTGIQDVSTGNDPILGASMANITTNPRMDA